jgi:hypothetical protein
MGWEDGMGRGRGRRRDTIENSIKYYQERRHGNMRDRGCIRMMSGVFARDNLEREIII